MGMVIGVYGLGHWWAAKAPLIYWPIVVVGLLGKVFGPIGFVFSYLHGTIPVQFCYIMLTNDFFSWVPLLLVLVASRKFHMRH